MAIEEKRAWIMVVVTVVAYAVYLAVVLGGSGGVPLADAPYAATLLWTVGGAIAGAVVLNVAVVALAPEDAGTDQRDREIGRFGDHVGHSFVVAGAVAAMLLAMIEASPFWIANTVYLAFVLSALLGSAARIVAYRRGFQPW